jgi:hypothetical protein
MKRNKENYIKSALKLIEANVDIFSFTDRNIRHTVMTMLEILIFDGG